MLMNPAFVCGVSHSILGQPWRWRGEARGAFDQDFAPDDLVERDGGRIVFVVLDGLGGLPHTETGRTELESARTPVLDGLCADPLAAFHGQGHA